MSFDIIQLKNWLFHPILNLEDMIRNVIRDYACTKNHFPVLSAGTLQLSSSCTKELKTSEEQEGMLDSRHDHNNMVTVSFCNPGSCTHARAHTVKLFTQTTASELMIRYIKLHDCILIHTVDYL